MCYQYPFAVLPVVVPAPESHRSVSIPLGTLVSLSEGHGILRRGIISPPDGYSIVKVQVPSLVWTGEGALLGCFWEVFIFPFTCSDWEARFGGVFLKGFFTLPLVRTEIPVFFGCFEKFLPLYLFPLGKAVWGGVLKNYLTPSLVPTEEATFFGCSEKLFISPSTCSHWGRRFGQVV